MDRYLHTFTLACRPVGDDASVLRAGESGDRLMVAIDVRDKFA